jgi:hypothetical protein
MARKLVIEVFPAEGVGVRCFRAIIQMHLSHYSRSFAQTQPARAPLYSQLKQDHVLRVSKKVVFRHPRSGIQAPVPNFFVPADFLFFVIAAAHIKGLVAKLKSLKAH